ncbi:unnamed protein product [Phytomonas sp. EM1]|nr:unnamed protein product [Phytomonas sp. EM1]|eukprot:CCW62286.1 unnamed protein product [Phytomonas sp. isolate EM1]
MQPPANFQPQVGHEVFSAGIQATTVGAWSSFPILWRTINEVCMQAFSIFENYPTKDLSVLYRELNANLCRAHALVYKLTAYPCHDCPSLVRGNNSARVVGDNQECTQVLVVYYLFRELLKKQVLQSKQALSAECYTISAYLDSFEKYSAGVNVTKCVFTYLQWVWQKVGLPSEHSILPTEVISLHNWTEHVLSDDVRECLKMSAMSTVNEMRQGQEVDYDTIENIKRLSLNLSMLSDSRQAFYVTILEEPYLANMSSFYMLRKPNYKRYGPENYVSVCIRTLKREEFLVKCTLCKQSLEKVRNHLIEILFHEEVEYLRPPVQACFANDFERDKSKSWLSSLYELIGAGSKSSWVEDVITSNVSEKASELIMKRIQEGNDDNNVAVDLNSIRETHHVQKKKIIDIFGPKRPLLVAMLSGLKIALDTYKESSVQDNEDFEKNIANSLAVFAVKETDSWLNNPKICDNWVADMYGFIEKKEVFHSKYMKLLKSRLLKNAYLTETKANCENTFQREQRMLSDLFLRGRNFDFAHSCQIMLKNVFTRSFDYKTMHRAPFELRPIVLNKFIWDGIAPPPKQDTNLLIKEVDQALENFQMVYKKNFAPGKCLSFLPHYSTCIVRMKTGDDADYGVRLILSSLQLRIVMAFNQQRKWRVSELEEKIDVSHSEFSEHLDKLVKANIFAYLPSSKSLHVVKPTRSSRKKFFLVPEIQHESVQEGNKRESIRSIAPIEREKAIAIEGCIVKSLKMNGSLSIGKIEEFVSEVLDKFSINCRDIKRILDKLIEREYVLREEESNTFRFIP